MMRSFPIYPLNLTTWRAAIPVDGWSCRTGMSSIHLTDRKEALPHPSCFGTGLCSICNKYVATMQALYGDSRVTDTSEQELREHGTAFMPRFDSAGLLSAVVQHATTGEVLMVAFMDAEAIAATKATGLAHFHSRSRGRLWKKGESSGDVLKVVELRVDCDQDALLIRALPAGPTCHTGARSCFYRVLDGDALAPVRT